MMGGLRRGAMVPLKGAFCGRCCCWQLRFSAVLPRCPSFVAGALKAKSSWAGLPLPPSRCRATSSLSPPAGRWLLPARFYSSDSEPDGRQKPRQVVVVGLPNPFIWIRTRLYFFLIRAYFDQEFSIHEFTKGAKHAFARVSRLISQCKYELLEELVSKEMVQMLKEKLSSLSENHRRALAADMDEIMFTTAGDVGIYYDDNGRKFVSILMSFWYLSSADIPDETPEGAKVFQIVLSGESTPETKRLLTANYEFQREFTRGVKPDWMITRIEHPNLLE